MRLAAASLAILAGSGALAAQLTPVAPSGEPRAQPEMLEVEPCLDCPPPGTLPPSVLAYLKAADTAPNDRFGRTLALSGDTLAVGAPNAAGETGAVYVFVRDGSSWSQQALLLGSNTEGGDLFGYSLALEGDVLVVGAQGERSNGSHPDDDSVIQAGAAYVFERDGATWTETAYLKAPLNTAFLHFGHSVAIAGDVVAVGTPREDGSSSGIGGDPFATGAQDSGAVFTFARSGRTWVRDLYIKPSQNKSRARFGDAIALHGDTLLAGAPDSSQTGEGPGRAFVFARTGNTWVEHAILDPDNGDPGDRFGDSVALWQDTAVVGAPNERSNAAGVNGDGSDNSGGPAGAAYVFERTGGLWEQRAYLKPALPSLGALFGGSSFAGNGVAVQGSRVAVSSSDSTFGKALRRLPSPLGQLLEQAGALQPSSGAVHLFERTSACWDHVGFAKPIHPLASAGSDLGNAVLLDGPRLVAGAPGESSAATGVNGDAYSDAAPGAGAVFVFDLGILAPPGAWSFEGCSLAGATGPVFLDGSGPGNAGSDNLLVLSNARPHAALTLFTGPAGVPSPFVGGVLLPSPAAGAPVGPTDADGAAELPLMLPAGLPPGSEVWAQVAVDDPSAPQGVALSNAVKATVR